MSSSPSPNPLPYMLAVFQRPESPEGFHHALAIRTEVFVEEQQVPLEEEQDVWDDTATHFLLMDPAQGNMPVATARMMGYEGGKTAKIGRVAVLKPYRGLGLGKHLMVLLLAEAQTQGYQGAVLDAQTHALGFYGQLGFVAEGEEFMDAGIPHYRMRRHF